MNLRAFSRASMAVAVLAMTAVLSAHTNSAQNSSTTPKKTRTRKHRKTVAVVRSTVVTSSKTGKMAARTTTQAAVIHTDTSRTLKVATARRRSRHYTFNPWTEPTYADSTTGDRVDGEDPIVRRAAVDALGPYNGSVVVADPETGRILSVVNQKLALKGAYQPCSTVKMVVSLASLSEGIVTADDSLHLTRRYTMDMTKALARSNNLYFAKLGQQLGFDRVEKYGRLFGLGEKAGLDIEGEEAGYLTGEPPQTGVGMMTSFGDGIRITPLELTSIVSTIANGGTMYYLQYPKTQEDADKFIPRIKRVLEMSDYIAQIKPGMMGAVEYGTARRAIFDANEPIWGKTGTCTDTAQPGVHLGWFASFNNVPKNKIAVVVLLTGGRGTSGATASGIAGNLYRNLSEQHYFGPEPTVVPASLVSMQNQ